MICPVWTAGRVPRRENSNYCPNFPIGRFRPLAKSVCWPSPVLVTVPLASRIPGGAGTAQRCACRKAHPPSSGGMSILVEDAAESLASSYVEVDDLLRIADRPRQGA